MTRFQWSLVFLSLSLITACRGGGNDCGDASSHKVGDATQCIPAATDGNDGNDGNDGSDGATPATETRVVGFVIDGKSSPVGDATISGGGTQGVTDGTGRFELVIPANKTTVLVVEKVGYAPTYHPMKPGGAAEAYAGITLFAVGNTAEVDPNIGGRVDVVDDASGTTVGAIEIPPGALVNAETGEPVADGTVVVQVTWISGATATVSSPIPLIGSDGADSWPLISYGMVDVTVTHLGARCNLAPDQVITLSVASSAGDPASAGLFSADLAAGIWLLEGAAVNDGVSWIAPLPHLSWWNVDAFLKVPKDKQCCVSFQASKANGKPASGVEVKGTIPGGFTFGGTTDYEGELCEERFPCDELVTANWRVFTSPPRSGPLSVTPYAKGAQCGTEECQVVSFVVPCAVSSDCASGETCTDGACVGDATDGNDGSDASDASDGGPCTPKCDPGQCSDDGCGQPCSQCPSGQSCGPAGVCVDCIPNCSGKLCGSDGCSGSCGICTADTSCDATGQCVSPCDFCTSGSCTAFGFEEQSPLSGWDVSGDAAVIPQLGGTSAPAGSAMLRLSTGLSTDSPSYAQKALCVQGGLSRLEFVWRLYSEEFEEYCGSTFQDYFTVSVLIAGAPTELLRVTIDDLCPAGANGCTTCGKLGVTLAPADVSFDRGGVSVAPWQNASLALPPGAESGTLVFEVRDIGDSAYDTVVLIDSIQLVP